MKQLLFVTNGHGEQAIAARIAAELDALDDFKIDHLSLVGEQLPPSDSFHPVGPARSLPSGGLIAMGNLRNLLRDLRAGLLTHTIAQLRFLGSVKGRYDLAIAVGDTFSYLIARRARAKRTAFVGTAKSVYVARYGPGEVRVLRSANAIFVRDQKTAADLQARGLRACAPGNVIVDLFADAADNPAALAGKRVAIFPGSREGAYADAVFACAIVRRLWEKRSAIEASLSIAPRLDPLRFAQVLRDAGWDVTAMDVPCVPFVLVIGDRPLITAWNGSAGAMLRDAQIVLGQAGTANEAAAARGIPIAAFDRTRRSAGNWYRQRQRGLLDGALTMLPSSVDQAADSLAALLSDEARRHAMGRIGRERMGAPGGARAIAMQLTEMLQC